MKQSEDGRTVEGMDILVPTIGEIIGGRPLEAEGEWEGEGGEGKALEQAFPVFSWGIPS